MHANGCSMDAAWAQPERRLCAGGPREINARSAEDRCGAVLSSGQAVGTEAHVVRRRRDRRAKRRYSGCLRSYTPPSFCRGVLECASPRLMFVSTIINRLSGLATACALWAVPHAHIAQSTHGGLCRLPRSVEPARCAATVQRVRHTALLYTRPEGKRARRVEEGILFYGF